MQLHLDRVVTDIGEAKAGLAIHSQNSSSEVEFRTRVFVRPNIVGGCKGTVDRARNPIFRAAGLDGNRAGRILKRATGAGRIIASRGQSCGKEQTPEHEKTD